MQHCPCTRDIVVPAQKYSNLTSTDGLRYDLSNTTCSLDAFVRGSGQKVVGFSIYGDLSDNTRKEREFIEGIAGNLQLMPRFYPGWTMRLYFELDDTHPIKKVSWCMKCRCLFWDLIFVLQNLGCLQVGLQGSLVGLVPCWSPARDSYGGCQQRLSNKLEVISNTWPTGKTVDIL